MYEPIAYPFAFKHIGLVAQAYFQTKPTKELACPTRNKTVIINKAVSANNV